MWIVQCKGRVWIQAELQTKVKLRFAMMQRFHTHREGPYLGRLLVESTYYY